MRQSLLILLLVMISQPAQAEPDVSWKIDASTPKQAPAVTPPTKFMPPPTSLSEATGAKVITKKTEDEVARAFGYTTSDQYASSIPPTGPVTKVSVAQLLGGVFPEAAALLPTYSSCKAKDFDFMQSVSSVSGGLQIYGIRRNCGGECFVTVEIKDTGGKISETTNEYTVNKLLCVKAMGGDI